jgi:hypothetical protein
MKTTIKLLAVMSLMAGASSQAADKTLIDYFLPMPVQGALVSNVWGAPNVLPRDAKNGLEDTTMTNWCYWDGQIIKASDGKFHLFASRWDQARGHGGWGSSLAVVQSGLEPGELHVTTTSEKLKSATVKWSIGKSDGQQKPLFPALATLEKN